MDKLQYAINAPASHGVSLDSLVDSPRYEEHLHVYVLLWDLAVKVGSMRTDACPRQRSHLPRESIPRNLRQATVCIYVPTLTELVRRDFAFKPESTAWKRLVAKTSWYVLVHVMTNACFSGAHCWKHKYAYICKYPKRNMHTYMHDCVCCACVCLCMLVICMYVCVIVCVCTCMLVCVCDICVCMGVYAGLLFQMYVYIICLRVSTYMNACVHVYIHLDGRVDAWKMCVCVRSVVKWPKKTHTRPVPLKSWHAVAVTTCSLRTAVCWSHCHCTMAWGSAVCWERGFGSIFLGTAAGLAGSGAFWYPRSTKRIGRIEDHRSCTYRKRG